MADTTARRIGVLTSGGDAPGLNAVLRAVVKAATTYHIEVLGIEDGYEGLIGEANYRVLSSKDVRGLLPQGGTILGTTNKGHFNPGVDPQAPDSPHQQAAATVRELGLMGLIVIGGEGTQGIALDLYKLGVPVVGVPKTIDNDLAGTDRTFGFDTALLVATDAIDRLHTTAASHNRIMVLEVMGRHAGWIALHSGIAGGSDVILIPEIPFVLDHVADKVRDRETGGSRFSIVVVAEGAIPSGGHAMYQAGNRLGGIGQFVCAQLEALTGKDSRVVVLGHVQRGGQPTPYDRLLASRFGVGAVTAIINRRFGEMVSIKAQEITTVPLAEACGALKTVPINGDLVLAARSLGISFGDE